MNVIDFIRLLRNHIVLLVIIPVLTAVMVFYMTRKPNLKYSSETMLYTGIATGSSVDMGKTITSLVSNTAFDNLINIIKSRQTQQEVAIRLLAQHLLLEKSHPRYISKKSLIELKSITPKYIIDLVKSSQSSAINPSSGTDFSVVKDTISAGGLVNAANDGKNNLGAHTQSGSKQSDNGINHSEKTAGDSVYDNEAFSFEDSRTANNLDLIPPSIDTAVYERIVKKLTKLKESNDTNFVYTLLNSTNPHYSISAISSMKVNRVSLSDLVSLHFESNDPGICRETLSLLIQTCIKNYRVLKENRSDAVIKYFEFQLKQAAARLTVAEDKLLKFNEDNNIINYYEQSKAIAGVKEQLDLDYNSKRVSMAGVQAAIVRLEEKLSNQEQIQLKSSKIIDIRNQLGVISYKITSLETRDTLDNKAIQGLTELKVQAEKLKDEAKTAVAELYKFGNTIDGLPISTVLNDWITNVIEAENLKAGLVVMAEKIKDFQKQYAIYAPAGANLKRIEREISVSEQEYLELLHELNQANLRMQDNELSSNIKAIDPPYFPVSPMPTKRMLLVLIGAVVGFVVVLFTILVMEYLDDTLKYPEKVSRILKIGPLGIFPKVLLDIQGTNFLFITNRLIEVIIQNIELYLKVNGSESGTKTLLFFSTLSGEGKSVIIGNLALKLKRQGKRVLLLNYSNDSLLKNETSQIGYQGEAPSSASEPKPKQLPKKSIVRWLLGYPDTRINIFSPFLEEPQNYLDTNEYFVYNINEKFYSVKNYLEILEQNNFSVSFTPDYVFIELPSILYNPYPSLLLSGVAIPVLVCRSNRNWTVADQASLEGFIKLAALQTRFILNGVELQVIESVLGDLPKKRSGFRRILKKLLRFQFFSRSQI